MDYTAEHSPSLWQRRPSTQLLAAAIGVLPLYTLAIWMHLTREVAYTLTQMMLYPLVFGGGDIVLILLLLRFMCGERASSLNLREGRWYRDVASAIILLLTLAALFFIHQATVAQWFPREGPSEDILNLIRGVARNPLLLALWLGPVVWVGVAGFEELSRVFFLSRLWRVWPGAFGRWLVLAASATMFGLAHIYQGPAGVISTAVFGLVVGWYYMRFGRVWPLIISHALYDSVQVVFAVSMVSRLSP